MAQAEEWKRICRPYWNEISRKNPVARIWRRDHTLWRPGPAEISNRLGWLGLPKSMRGAVEELTAFASEVCDAGFRDVVLLGMGGSSLSAEVLRRTVGRAERFPRLRVLDSTMPATIGRLTCEIEPASTLFLVSSKSGSTVEVLSFYRYFRQRVEEAKGDEAGKNFVAITDAGSSLAKMAEERAFRRTFINPSDVGGRYSALSCFGLVPAALIGADVSELLSRGQEMARACSVEVPLEENPGAWLGFAVGCLTRRGRDKLTMVTSPALGGFGLWAEQLVAESTGKSGRGTIPIAQEPFGPAEAYGDDRLFAYLRMADDDNAACDQQVDSLEQAGFPVLRYDLKDVSALGGEFFKWEFAIAVAGACLRINPFDQPNVQESKDITGRMLAEYEQNGALPRIGDEGSFAQILEWAKKGDYVALMAFADETPELNDAFTALRHALLTKRRLPTTLGYGPRFLHSTGQLFKGGPDKGLFVQFTAEQDTHVAIPGVPYDFGTLATAQAIGDFSALKARGRRAIRIHAGKAETVAARVRSLADEV